MWSAEMQHPVCPTPWAPNLAEAPVRVSRGGGCGWRGAVAARTRGLSARVVAGSLEPVRWRKEELRGVAVTSPRCLSRPSSLRTGHKLPAVRGPPSPWRNCRSGPAKAGSDLHERAEGP